MEKKDSLKAILVGFGSIGKRHYNNLMSLFNGKILVCTKQKTIKNKTSNLEIFSSIDNCLKENPEIGFVTNVTNLHIDTATKLAKTGCHLFIEKPLSNSISGVQKLLDVVERKKLITLMGCNLRFHPCLLAVKKLLSEKKIGQVISVYAENGSYLPDWHPDEDYKKNYAARDEMGGGVVLTCIHEIDYLYWFFGDVDEVYSITGKFSNLGIDSDDLSAVIIKFKNNIIAELHLDYFQRPSSRYCKIIGTKGTIYWDFQTNLVKYYDVSKKKWITVIKLTKYDFNEMYVKEIKHFLNCVRKNQNTINDIHDGLKILKIAMAILKSSKTRLVIRL